MTAHTHANANLDILSADVVRFMVIAVTSGMSPYTGASWWANLTLTCTVHTRTGLSTFNDQLLYALASQFVDTNQHGHS